MYSVIYTMRLIETYTTLYTIRLILQDLYYNMYTIYTVRLIL